MFRSPPASIHPEILPSSDWSEFWRLNIFSDLCMCAHTHTHISAYTHRWVWSYNGKAGLLKCITCSFSFPLCYYMNITGWYCRGGKATKNHEVKHGMWSSEEPELGAALCGGRLGSQDQSFTGRWCCFGRQRCECRAGVAELKLSGHILWCRLLSSGLNPCKGMLWLPGWRAWVQPG